MRETWIEYGKKADFNAWSKTLHVTPLVARILRNRGMENVDEAFSFLYGTKKDLANPLLFKDMEKTVSYLAEAIETKTPIAIVSDYDCDGIFSGQILYEGLKRCGARVGLYTPNRRTEGYGINLRIVDEAYRDGCRVILTCDNGISAMEVIAYAKEKGFRVLVTDHHDIPFRVENGENVFLLPPADAIIDPQQNDCAYPFPYLCGAGVAFRLMEALYRKEKIPAEELEEFYEYVAIATIADVVPLKGENRILVRLGLAALKNTKKVPLRALYEASGISAEKISSYTVGFVLAPCFNAVGRLSDVSYVFRFLRTKDEVKAAEMAEHIRLLNEERKEKTEDGYRKALALLESDPRYAREKVWLLNLTDVDLSVVGIVAGRIKERFYHPVFVFTDAEDGTIRGSGRSIPGYPMSDALNYCRELLLHFGGHRMAAGLTLKKEKLEELRTALNASCPLTDAEMKEKIYIDARAPLSYMTEPFVEELRLLEPYGTENEMPLFAEAHFHLRSFRVLGQERKVLKMTIADSTGVTDEAMWFDDPEIVFSEIRSQYGEETLQRLKAGGTADIDLAFTYYPEIHEFRSVRSVQIHCKNCGCFHSGKEDE